MKAIFHEGKLKVTDDNDQGIDGAKLTFYDTGTSNLQTTYSDYARSSANTNPVVTDSEGRCIIFLKKNVIYDYTLTDSADVLIYPKFVGVVSLESHLTTKGDLHVYTTDDTRLAVGTDGQVLKSDSSAASGLAWGAGTDTTLTTKGDIYTYDTGNARLAVGNDNSILIADSSETTGLKWVAELVRATTAGTQAFTSSTWTTVEFDTETQDSDSIFDNTTYTATISDTGWYSGYFYAGWDTAESNDRVRIVLNGSDHVAYNTDHSGLHLACSFVRYLTAADTLICQVDSGASNGTMLAGANFHLRRLG